jgi:hypothetical protein
MLRPATACSAGLAMDLSDRLATIRIIRDATVKLVAMERAQIKHRASWADYGPIYYYMLDLSPESLLHVRLHGQLFGAGEMGSLLDGFARITPENFRNGYGYGHALEGLPSEYYVAEPPIPLAYHRLADPTEPKRLIPLGCDIDGRWVTPDTARYQNYIANLYRIGFFEWANALERKITVMEFGAGYGAFGYYLMKLFPGKIRYVVVDLPMMLLFPGCFLAANLPGLRAWIYDAENPQPVDIEDGNDLYLVPNHRFELVRDLPYVDLAINTISMPEMESTQAESYLDYLKAKLIGPFLYHNYEQPRAVAAVPSTIDRVSKRLRCLPDPALFERYTRETGDALLMHDLFAFSPSIAQFKPEMEREVYLRMNNLVYIRTTLGSSDYQISKWPIAAESAPAPPARPALLARLARLARRI